MACHISNTACVCAFVSYQRKNCLKEFDVLWFLTQDTGHKK